MKARYISAYGGIAGFLLGTVITLVYNLPFADAAYRLLTLSICGAWMGAIIAWLDHLLPKNEERDSVETEN
ncbi:hypothetical protein Ga0123462_2102 [Mariprofundus ferrinatatus]|uniref:Uncharacterized protein n=1 Tax=Mariprofundus ferrinatatus TaxID=1921087 RepID=A0A2K8L6M7_9PROT|nr:hypothetical protein [Mariprofundus ferrinatatus]ATX82937.1 hypothetical protein Ga0123462_2102 [Mariprofundus ferrinatatus]